MAARHWWEERWFLAAVALLSAVPLLLPETPPLVDVPGHIGRYRVQLDGHSSEQLRQFFTFNWALIGNLGIDLLIIPLEPIFGLELSVKLIVLTIPPLTVAGIFFVAREIHGRVPPAALFAVPFVYGHSFNFGFINFALSMALALLALGYWLRLERHGRLRLRAALFVPISCLIWLVHAFGWGVLGLMAFSTELVRQHDASRDWPKSVVRAGFHVAPLALPLILTIFWRSGAVEGLTDQFFDVLPKLFSLTATLRDRWLVWDSFSVAVALVLIGAAILDARLEMSRRLAIPAAILALMYCLLPGRIFGSAYADMRLAPFMIMLAILAIRFRDDKNSAGMHRLAWLGAAFLVLRLAGNAISFEIADRETRARLNVLEHIPMGAKVLTLAWNYCDEEWKMPRHTHLGGFVITRRLGFANNQWQTPGAQLLSIHYPEAGKFAVDRSVFIYSQRCIAKSEKEEELVRKRKAASGEQSEVYKIFGRSTEQALGEFPREAFDFVWLLEPPDFDMGPRTGLIPIWRGPDSVLYRVDRPVSAKPRHDDAPSGV